MSQKHDLLVMLEMSISNMDISASPTFVDAKKTKQGGLVTIGVGPEVFDKIQNGFFGPKQYLSCLYTVNIDQYQNLKQSPKTGAQVFIEERLHQIVDKGYTKEFQAQHPEYYNAGQLGYAARELSKKDTDLISTVPPTNWNHEWWSQARLKPFRDRLRIAGGLLAAYYDNEFVD